MGFGPQSIGPRAHEAVRAAIVKPLMRAVNGWQTADGRKFNSCVVYGALDKGALDYDPFTDTMAATEKGRVAVSHD